MLEDIPMQRLHIGYDHGTKQLVFYHTLSPEWLIHTGTHGDEWGVIGSVERYLKANAARLPCFVWVPEVSPSAVRRGTRKNANRVDLNRSFRDDATDAEIRANLALMQRWAGPFRLFLSFHEDRDREREWYLYDTDDAPQSAWLTGLLSAAEEIGVAPYSGPDNDTDEAVTIRNGYFSERWDGGGFTRKELYGQAPIYTIRNNLALRGFTFEVPGRAPWEVKDRLVAVIFEHLLRLELHNPG